MRRPRVGKRLTGVSTPFGGASWETVPDIEGEVLGRLVTFLEDRRVLYNPSEAELPSHCVESVLVIRAFVIDAAGRLHRDSDLATNLRRMAGACRRFLDRVGPRRRGLPPDWGFSSWEFNQALGELRGQIGFYLDELVQRHGLHIEPPLDSILPPPPDTATADEDDLDTGGDVEW